jgi:hypothetical protein
MEQRILNYRKYIDELLGQENVDWESVISEHLIQVSFFQHERLIHLIVTVTFALMEVIVMGLCVTAFSPGLGLLALLILVLLVPYVRHYYILENEVQKMYKQYDEMIQRSKAK